MVNETVNSAPLV